MCNYKKRKFIIFKRKKNCEKKRHNNGAKKKINKEENFLKLLVFIFFIFRLPFFVFILN